MARTRTLYQRDPYAASPVWLVREQGKLVRVSGNQSILLDDPSSVWVIVEGGVDVFSVRLQDGQETGPRSHVFRAETGAALFGVPIEPERQGIVLLVSSVPGTSLFRISRSRLQEIAQDLERGERVVRFLDSWVNGLALGLREAACPQEYEPLAPGQEISLAAGEAAFPRKGTLWVSHQAGNSRFVGGHELPGECAEGFLPVSRYTWLQAVDESELCVVDTEAYVAQDPTWSGVDRFNQLAVEHLSATAERAREVESKRLEERADADRSVLEDAFARLASVLEAESTAVVHPETRGSRDPLFLACLRVGDAMGLAIRPHPDFRKGRVSRDPLGAIARALRIRTRQVMLRGEWWRYDNGPLLAYVGDNEGEYPVALLPVSPRKYELHDPVRRSKTPVTPDLAATLYPLAYAFYRPFPTRALAAWDLCKFGLRATENDLLVVLLMGAAAGVLGLLTPLATGWIFNDVIPGAEEPLLWQIVGALVASALASAVFQFARNVAVLRIEMRTSASVQAAIWDRLLSLPVPFFRRYSAGDLASRARGIDTIRRRLTGATVMTVLSGVFSVFNLGLLFYYDPRLAGVATGLVLAAVAVTALVSHMQMDRQRTVARIRGRISGMILQFITGISKLRVAGAEGRAFAVWAQEFSVQKKLDLGARRTANSVTVFNASYPILTLMALFAMVAFSSRDGSRLSTGDFVAFYAAFGQLLSAGLLMSSTLTSIWGVLPIYERVKPILQTMPEVDEAKSDPGELTGEIEVEHVNFRYEEDGPLIIQDMCLHVMPGEFVALAGPSGSGKSTLARLLLGFETPDSGAIYYDGQNLADLDVRAVRRQMGVVLQNGKLMTGDILTNIIGSSLLTVDDAWEAARMVGLDRDIEEMPMGMYTVISEGGGTLSGGQRQRILIARAIVHRPRILFFDEATSALDNTTQAIVSESLERLQVTRIVIAHRLSTITEADRILVLNKGRVVQSGPLDELVKQQGLFARLAQRQYI